MWLRETLYSNGHTGWSYMDDAIEKWYEMIQPNNPKGIRILMLNPRECYSMI